ncbi:PfkB family carbohydrate kinase [Escherichia coli]|uniref:PfkB family carbohydrate kinase n=1 Tax=Escherichia coli TaxID=562 RepID=UPI003FD30B76
MKTERILGALYGQALGDAMGMPSELWPRSRVKAHFGWIDRFLPGPKENNAACYFNRAEFTDDTSMALCLALVEPDGERTFMSFSGVENQWNRQWLARLTVAPGSLLYFSGYQLASPCGELLVEWLEELQDVTPFIDFGPRIGDIPDALLARIMACRPLVSLNRQEAEIAAERFALSAEITTLGKQWQEKFAAPLIVRLDKEGAWYFSNDASGCIPAFPTQVVDTIGAGDSHAGGVLAGLASGLPLADAVLLGNAVASWVVGHRGGDCAPTREELLLAHKNV